MGNFNRDDRSGGGRSFGGRRDFNNRGPDRPMFKAVCSKCTKECEVPFRPSGRPVFCLDCFRANRDADPRGLNRNSNVNTRPPENPQSKEQFETLNRKIDKILSLLTSVVPTEVDIQTLVTEKKKRPPKKVSVTPEE